MTDTAKVREAVEAAQGCFDAAFIEGLSDRLAEEEREPGSLRDLIERRILVAQEHIAEALASLTEDAGSEPAIETVQQAYFKLGYEAGQKDASPPPVDGVVELGRHSELIARLESDAALCRQNHEAREDKPLHMRPAEWKELLLGIAEIEEAAASALRSTEARATNAEAENARLREVLQCEWPEDVRDAAYRAYGQTLYARISGGDWGYLDAAKHIVTAVARAALSESSAPAGRGEGSAAVVPETGKMPASRYTLRTDGPGDWPEDFTHENGNYFCTCRICGNTFTGHKRRVQCKACALPPTAPNVQPTGETGGA